MLWLEADTEKSLRIEAIKRKSDFMMKNPSINGSELEEFLDFVLRSNQQGISVLDNDAYEQNWSLGQSFLFTVSVVTTIGYGHITPITQIGKLVCVLYGILGIPFTLVFLSAMVQRLLYPTCSLLSLLFASRIADRLSPFNIRLIHLAFLALVFTVFFVLIPSAIFWTIEVGWTYLDAFYFVFISLTTIGLGDYIPGITHNSILLRDIYQACVAGYLLLGLVFMTLTLTVFYDIPQLNLGLRLHKHMDIHITEDQLNDEQKMSDDGLEAAAASLPLNGIRQKLSRISMRRNSISNLFRTNQSDEEHTALTGTGNNAGS